MPGEGEIRRGTSSRPIGARWSLLKHIYHGMDHLLKNRWLCFPRFWASFRTEHQLRSCVPTLCLLFLLFVFSLRPSLKEFAYFFLKICTLFFSLSALSMFIWPDLFPLLASGPFCKVSLHDLNSQPVIHQICCLPCCYCRVGDTWHLKLCIKNISQTDKQFSTLLFLHS